MAKFEIIVGSVLGATEYVADALQEKLQQLGHESTIHLTPTLDEIDQNAHWLICTSTHGAGDLPDNIQPFADQLKNQTLQGLEYMVIGLGDSSYDTYCYGAMQMQDIMQKAQAKQMFDPLHIDVLHHPIPEDKAALWLEEKLAALESK